MTSVSKTESPAYEPGSGTQSRFRTGYQVPSILGAAAVLVLLVGVTWDIAWHVDIGRDTFFTPPHWLIVGGIGMLGSAALVTVARMGRRPDRVRAAINARPGMVLTGFCAALMLVGLGIDNWWHGIFGIDVSLWSPPHVALLILGLLAAVGLTADRAARPSAGQPVVSIYAGATMASGLVFLAEYDHGIPHFALYWSGPVLAAVLGAGLGLAARASRNRWAGLIATTSALALSATAAGFVLAAGRSVPTVHPSVVVAGLVFDLVRRRHRRRARSLGLALSAAVAWLAGAAIEWPWLRLVGHIWWSPSVAALTIGLGLGAVMAATLIGASAGSLVNASGEPRVAGPDSAVSHHRPRRGAVTLALIVIGLALIGAAGSRRTPTDTLNGRLVIHGRDVALIVPGASSHDWASIWHWDGARRGDRWQAGLTPEYDTFTGRLPKPLPTTMIWLIHKGTAWSAETASPDGLDRPITLNRVRSQTQGTVPPWLTPVAYILVAALLGCGIVATDILLSKANPNPETRPCSTPS